MESSRKAFFLDISSFFMAVLGVPLCELGVRHFPAATTLIRVVEVSMGLAALVGLAAMIRRFHRGVRNGV